MNARMNASMNPWYMLCTAVLAEAEEAEMTDITPTLIRFVLKFFTIFAVIAVVGVLTPWIAKQVDAVRMRHTASEQPEDPRCAAVRGSYDMQKPESEEAEQQPESDPNGGTS